MAGQDELVVHYSSLQATASDIKGAAAVIQREIEAMKSAVGKVAEGWQGEAHTAMKQAQDQLQKRADHIKQILEKVSQDILTGGDHYQATDRKSAGLFS
ncbi:WXG100 family type VII secretion target [Streptomyces sp. NPDC053079]|uniref:WXG100 family type VII secretion target n=1 Tax=Streptomyces sp. NPDC053079 TaxID=3365697 RepID=UPI0037D29C8F